MSRDDLSWFHGNITRENADELLKNANEDGSFLIRECHTANGDFVLALFYQNQVYQYQIRRHGEDAFFSIDDKVKILHGLDTLVEFYKQASNGICTRLTTHLKCSPPPNDTRSHGHTNLLHRATKENNQTVVSELLKCGYRNVDAKNEDGQTAVHLAAIHSDETIVKLLLAAGVNVNCMDAFGYMPLHYACRNRPASFIRTLIEGNANVQARNIKNGCVPLHEAAKHGNLEAVQELLAANAPLLPRTSSGEFPLDLAEDGQHADVVAFLKNYKLATVTTTQQSQWYHGTLSREEAVSILKRHAAKMKLAEMQLQLCDADSGQSVDTSAQPAPAAAPTDLSGCFLVRYSPGGSNYVLTLLWNGNVKNFKISETSTKYLYIDEGPYLSSLEHLVEHFMRFADGLPVALKYPVPPKPKPEPPSFSTMPRSMRKKPSDRKLSQTEEDHKGDRKHSLDTLNVNDSPTTSEKHSQTLTPKKKQKENSGSVVNTLLSPTKSLMDTLRKSKSKRKQSPPAVGEKATRDRKTSEEEAEKTKKTETMLKELSFKVNLQKKTSDTATSASILPDGFYNVPKNNAAIPMPELEVETKTEAEVEYFTKSDVEIERERAENTASGGAWGPPVPNTVAFSYPLNENGYVPTVDLRVFLDHGNGDLPTCDTPQEVLEQSAAELRAFSQRPDLLDSHLSTLSTDSEMARFLARQTSTGSTATQNSAVMQTTLNYLIPSECLQLDEVIGGGEFGSVYKGWLTRRNEERCQVAIKTLRSERCHRDKQEVLREASVMIRLQHHCIVRLVGISKGETLMMVQELLPLGSMLDFIVEHKEKINPNYELKVWASQIACGMEYLESQHFVHRDLAARNILLASRNQAKISDFGLSRALGSDDEFYKATQGGRWPVKWYAPENFEGLFSHASDVWSFGVTLWEMFSLGEAPFGNMRGVDVVPLIKQGQRLAQPPLCPGNVYQVMLRCWNAVASERPTFHHLTDFFALDPGYQNIMELIRSEEIS